MTNYKLEIRYDGTRYYGWEKQPNVETIQGKLEAVFSRMTGKPVDVIGAGRTDAGVHARKMTANVHLDTDLSEEAIFEYVNRYLPDDIAVTSLHACSNQFHARYNAIGKLYTYTCYLGQSKPVFDRRYVTILTELPDIEKMQEAAQNLIGTHDFRSFCANTHMKKSTVRRIDSIEIVKKSDHLYFHFHGNGFLRGMVRILVGTLLEVGYGRMPADQMKNVLEGCDRALSGPAAPPQGLMLMYVEY